MGLHRSNVLYPPCAAAELHMRFFVNLTLDEIQEMVDKANRGEIDPIYIDYVEVVYVTMCLSHIVKEIFNEENIFLLRKTYSICNCSSSVKITYA